jgi:Fe-Mn family superoxide dismutase
MRSRRSSGSYDFAKAPGFLINGLKREELIASNSMILHELFFSSLGDDSVPEGALRDALTRDFGGMMQF